MEKWGKREGSASALHSEEKLTPPVQRRKREPPALEKVDIELEENGGEGELVGERAELGSEAMNCVTVVGGFSPSRDVRERPSATTPCLCSGAAS